MTTSDELLKTLDKQIIEMRMNFSYLKENLESFKNETHISLKEIKEDQSEIQAIFNRGKGVIWLLMVLGGAAGILITFGRDLFKPWL